MWHKQPTETLREGLSGRNDNEGTPIHQKSCKKGDRRCGPRTLLEARPGFEPGVRALQARALPLGHLAVMKKADIRGFAGRPDNQWSGLRDSNPRPPPWQGGALPTALSPRAGNTICESGRACKNFFWQDFLGLLRGETKCSYPQPASDLIWLPALSLLLLMASIISCAVARAALASSVWKMALASCAGSAVRAIASSIR